MPDLLEPLLLFFERGGAVLGGIVALSVLMWTLILERYWYLLRLVPRLRADAGAAWQAARRQGQGVGCLARPVARRLRRSILTGFAASTGQFLEPIRSLAAILPMLGLLGTVSGMIKTFDVITLYGTGNVRGMAAGISEALITTMAGLLTAISGLYFSANLDRRMAREQQRLAYQLPPCPEERPDAPA